MGETTETASSLARPRPWQLPARGLSVFHGPGDTPRLSHYFLPRLLLQGKRVLFLDGANSADPRLLARLARERGVPFEQFSRQIQIARAFTCFQLTELIARVPRFARDFPAEVLIVTAFPELYYDEDVRDWDARVAFEQALADLRRWATQPLAVAVGAGKQCLPERHALTPSPSPAGRGGEFKMMQHPLPKGRGCPPRRTGEGNECDSSGPLAVAVFSAAPSFAPPPPRRRFFSQTCASATEVWEFSLDENRQMKLSLAATARAQPRLGG